MDERAQPGVVIGWNRDGTVIRVSSGSDGVLKRPSAQLIGRPLDEVLGITKKEADLLTSRALAGDPSPVFLRGKTGATTPWYRIVPGQQDGELVAGLVDLEQLLEGAPPVQISRISSLVSHELRNPL